MKQAIMPKSLPQFILGDGSIAYAPHYGVTVELFDQSRKG